MTPQVARPSWSLQCKRRWALWGCHVLTLRRDVAPQRATLAHLRRALVRPPARVAQQQGTLARRRATLALPWKNSSRSVAPLLAWRRSLRLHAGTYARGAAPLSAQTTGMGLPPRPNRSRGEGPWRICLRRNLLMPQRGCRSGRLGCRRSKITCCNASSTVQMCHPHKTSRRGRG